MLFIQFSIVYKNYLLNKHLTLSLFCVLYMELIELVTNYTELCMWTDKIFEIARG